MLFLAKPSQLPNEGPGQNQQSRAKLDLMGGVVVFSTRGQCHDEQIIHYSELALFRFSCWSCSISCD